ncbi:MAG: tetratricopeptide repeat protein [Anaerolineae bacterium]|nr:tetratricopeptide repeat protein [Anaerolineae bacterium]
MDKTLDVFISSKMLELATERDALFDLFASLKNEIFPIRAWIFEKSSYASSHSSREIYLEVLHNSRLYIGLFWNLYGEWTVDEFEHAKNWGIEQHIYVKNINPEHREKKLQIFLESETEVAGGISPSWFKTTEELLEKVRNSVKEWVLRIFYATRNISAVLHSKSKYIPYLPDILIGREQVVDQVEQFLKSNSHVVLYGSIGTGKTAIAATVSSRYLTAHKRKTVLWLTTGNENADIVLESLAIPFGLREKFSSLAMPNKVEELRKRLERSSTGLIVLDNVWDGQMLYTIQSAIPDSIALIATARHPFPLQETIEVNELQPDKAFEMLTHLVGSDIKLWDGSESDAAEELCQRLGYLPFGLEIAGKNMHENRTVPSELLEQYANSLHEMHADFAEPGRESMLALLIPSLSSVDEFARTTFMAFGALFQAKASTQLLALYLASTEKEIRKHLYTLQRYGLVKHLRQEKGLPEQWYILDLSFSYVSARTLDRQHISGIAAYVKRYQQTGSAELIPASARVDLEGALKAVAWATSTNHIKEVDYLEQALYKFMLWQGLYTQLIALLGYVAKTAEKSKNRQRQAQVWSKLGNVLMKLGKLDDAVRNCELAITVATEIGDLYLKANNLITLAHVYIIKSDYPKSMTACMEARKIATKIKDPETKVFALSAYGTTHSHLGNLKKALYYQKQCLTISKNNHLPLNQANSLNDIGKLYSHQNKKRIALSYFEKALALYTSIGAFDRRVGVIHNLGMTYTYENESQKGLDYLQEALTIYRERSDQDLICSALGDLGNAYYFMKNYQEAIRYLKEGLTIAENLGMRRLEANLLNTLGASYHELGDTKLGAEKVNKAISISREIGDEAREAMQLYTLGDLYFESNQFSKSLQPYQASYEIYVKLQAMKGIKDTEKQIERAKSKIPIKKRGAK